jgi:hypothetical protein
MRQLRRYVMVNGLYMKKLNAKRLTPNANTAESQMPKAESKYKMQPQVARYKL